MTIDEIHDRFPETSWSLVHEIFAEINFFVHAQTRKASIFSFFFFFKAVLRHSNPAVRAKTVTWEFCSSGRFCGPIFINLGLN